MLGVETLSCATTINRTFATDLVEMNHSYLTNISLQRMQQCSPFLKTISLETEPEFTHVLGKNVFGIKV